MLVSAWRSTMPHLRLAPIAEGISLIALHETQLDASLVRREELELLSDHAVPKRRNEFALGRCAARLALRECGEMTSAPVLQSGREPVWPTGFVGSITHCAGWAAAAVARSDSFKAIGIDLEDSSAIPVNEIVDLVCTERERATVFGEANPQEALAAVFSAKEAVYKALFPICRSFFDFHAVELIWLPDSHSFIGTLRQELAVDLPAGYHFRIGCQRDGKFVFTHVAIAK